MYCPKCNSKSIVIDTRQKYPDIRFRRYECLKCKFRFNTKEMVSGKYLQELKSKFNMN